MRKEFLEEVIACDEKIEYFEKLHKWLGYIKLVELAVFFICLFRLFTAEYDFLMIVVTLALFELYIFLAVIHWKTDMLREENQIKKTINQNYIDRIDGNWSGFIDKGEEFINKSHNYSSDLDLFGDNSLFQYLNTTKTSHGRKRFASDLTSGGFDISEIKKRQKAVWELSANKNFTVNLQYEGSKILDGHDVHNLISQLAGGEKQKPLKFAQYLQFVPVLTSAFVIAVFVMKVTALYIPAFVVIAAHIILWMYGTFKYMGELGRISGASYKISQYSKLFEMVEKRSFECEKLRDIKGDIASPGFKVSEAVKELNFIIMKIDLRRSVITYFLLNLFLLWDINCAFSLRNWQSKYGGQAEKWFDALGELESLLSFTNLSFVEENSCIPKITTELKIEGSNLGHPLINCEKRVNNNVSINKQIYIISGSNMSGKTTFLRTVGINIVLGLAGGFCCAVELKIPNVKIATSMRISDDLSEGVSTFYAELERIKGIIEICKDGEAIFLIDEIFRGTNSNDRLEGARSVLKDLEAKGALGIITTHDLALCDEADGNRILNYSFSESYLNNEIVFDYKLREGRSSSTNAKFLMGKLGIINNNDY